MPKDTTQIDQLANSIIRDVAELRGDYRADDPEVMRVSVNDLFDIITSQVDISPEKVTRLEGQMRFAKCDIWADTLRAQAAEIARLRAALLVAAPHHQGGDSEAGRAIAAALGIPFPIRPKDIYDATARLR